MTDNGDKEVAVNVDTDEDLAVDIPDELTIIPIINSPIFPGMIAPIILTEDKVMTIPKEWVITIVNPIESIVKMYADKIDG